MVLTETNLSEEEWYNFNFELKNLLKQELAVINDNVCPDQLADKITNTYQTLIDKYMPYRKLSRREISFVDKPWITNEIRAYIRKYNYLFRKSKRTNDPEHIEEHRVYRNLLAKLKQNAYEKYYREKIVKYGANKSKTWRIINEITGRKRKKGAAPTINLWES